MGYLEGPLSLNPSDREPKTTIVTRVMLGTVLTTAAQLALPSVLAVWRLMMNSNLTACIIGRSAGINADLARPQVGARRRNGRGTSMAGFVLCALCRFLDAGITRLPARSASRRPKSAKARSRGKCFTQPGSKTL